MKIIVSHDVDHLYPSDHIFKELFFPKLWFRSFIELLSGEIKLATFFYRISSILDKRLNRIPELVEYDIANRVYSTFFFGMGSILGMSYSQKSVTPWIKYVLENGMDAGVHGVEIEDINRMKQEYLDFRTISNLTSFGIRTHYVRYSENTHSKMADIGYLYDSSIFNKETIDIQHPYSIGNLWEFPLFIMDTYIIKLGIKHAIEQTQAALNNAETQGVDYFTFLFHDFFFNKKAYPKQKKFYEWFIDYCRSKDYQFISYRDAIAEYEKYTLKND